MTLLDVDEWYALGFNLLEGVVIGNERIPTLTPHHQRHRRHDGCPDDEGLEDAQDDVVR